MKSNEINKKRISSIELLKIIAIIFVVMSHVIPFNYINPQEEYINIGVSSLDYNCIIFQLIRYLGQIGNVIFIICSAWFLLDKKKSNYEKVLTIIIDCLFISLSCLLIIYLRGYDLDKKTMIRQFIPLTTSNNWFVLPYLLMYILCPILNSLIDSISKDRLKKIAFFLAIFNIWQFFHENKYVYCNLITFISIYFIIAYFKKYKIEFINRKRINIVLLIISVISLIISVIIIDIIGINVTSFNNKIQSYISIKNPMVFIISFSMFNLFRQININSKIINAISKNSLIIYLIHDNYLIRNYIRGDWFKYIYKNFGYDHIVIISIISAILTFIISLILSFLYEKTIKRIIIIMIAKIKKQVKDNEQKKYCKKLHI